jgi:HSP20 family protein
MSIIRWKPVQELMTIPSGVLEMEQNMNRMFGGLFGDLGTTDRLAWNPAVDVEEKDQEYIVRVELPGVRKEDVQITARENTLTIRGEKKLEKETRESNFHRTERSYGSFERSFALPGNVSSGKIEASFRDGILEVTVPKAEETKARTIEVKVR